MEGRGKGNVTVTSSSKNSTTREREIGISDLVSEMLKSGQYDLDSLLAGIQKTGKIEVLSYTEQPGDMFHEVLTLLDLSQESQDKLCDFMDGFLDHMCRVAGNPGNVVIQSLINSVSNESTIFHLLAEKSRITPLFSMLFRYITPEELQKHLTSHDEDERTPIRIMMNVGNAAFFEEMMTALGENECHNTIRSALGNSALRVLFEPITEFECQVQAIFVKNILPEKPLSRSSSQIAHIDTKLLLLDRIESIYTKKELCEQAMLVDKKGQNLLIFCSYMGQSRVLERCEKFYTDAYDRKVAASQILPTTSASAVHIVSAYGQPRSLEVLRRMLGVEGMLDACRHAMVNGMTPLHCCYSSVAESTQEREEQEDIASSHCKLLGNELVSVVSRDRTPGRKFLLQDSLERDLVIIDALNKCQFESALNRSELLLSILCRLPIEFFGESGPQRRGSIPAAMRTVSPKLERAKETKKEDNGLWEKLKFAPHLVQAGLVPTAHGNDLYLKIDKFQGSNPGLMQSLNIAQRPAVQQISAPIFIGKPTDAQRSVVALCTKLLGIQYPHTILCGLIEFVRDLHASSPLITVSYNDWLASKLIENFSQQADAKTMGFLVALHCMPNEKYRAACAEKLNIFAEGLVQLFVTLEKSQKGLSSKVISLLSNRSTLLGATICDEFNLDPQKLNTPQAFEKALRFNLALSANKIIVGDLISKLSDFSLEELTFAVEDVTVLSLYLQNVNQLMVALSQLGDGTTYREQIVNSTRDFLKKLGSPKLIKCVTQLTAKGTNIFHQLAIFKKLDFVLDILANLLESDLLVTELTRADSNGATPFHYAGFFGHAKMIDFLQAHVDINRLRQVGEQVTSLEGYNVAHMISISNDDDRVKIQRQCLLEGSVDSSSPLPQGLNLGSAIKNMHTVVQIYGESAKLLLLKADKQELTPIAHCCLTGNAHLIAEVAAGFKSSESKLAAVRFLIEPARPSRNIIPIQLMQAFGNEFEAHVDSIEILSVLLQPNSQQEIRLFVNEEERQQKIDLKAMASRVGPAPSANKASTSPPTSPGRQRLPEKLDLKAMASKIGPAPTINKASTSPPTSPGRQRSPAVQRKQTESAQYKPQDGSNPESSKKLAELKLVLINQLIGFDCPTEVYQCLKSLVEINVDSQPASYATYKGRLLPVILDRLSKFHSETRNNQFALLILVAHIKVGIVPNDLEQKCVQHCKNQKEIFGKVLLEFNQWLSQQKPRVNFQWVGKTFSNPTLLRIMVCGSFDVLDDSLKQILTQWDLKEASAIAKLKNQQGHTLLRVVLHKLISSKESPQTTALVAMGFCDFIGRELLNALLIEDVVHSDSVMHVFSDYPALHEVAASVGTWFEPDLLTKMLRSRDAKLKSVLTRSCENDNAGMLSYLNHQIDAASIDESYPGAKNILHAYLLSLTKHKQLDDKIKQEHVITCLTTLLELVGPVSLTQHAQQIMSDGRNICHIFAEFPALYFTFAFFETLLGREKTISQSTSQQAEVKPVLTVACENQNSKMIYWTLKTLVPSDEDFDLESLSESYQSPMHYICATGDTNAFEFLSQKLGRDNLKTLVNSLDEDVFSLICMPSQLGDISIKQLLNKNWHTQLNVSQIPRLQPNECRLRQNLLEAVGKLYECEELNKKAFVSSALVLACRWGDVDLVKQTLGLFSTTENRQQACLTRLTTLNVTALESSCLSDQNTSEGSLVRADIIHFICQTLAGRLQEAVIRPLSKNDPSLINISLATDRIIVDYLLQQDSSSQSLALLFEISRGNAVRENVYVAPPAQPLDSSQDNLTTTKTVSPESNNSEKKSTREEIRLSRRRSMPSVTLPSPQSRARSPSPRRRSPSRAATLTLDVLEANSQPLEDSQLQEKKLGFIQTLLGGIYPPELLRKVMSLVQGAYINSWTDRSAQEILINALANSKLVDTDPLTPYASIVMALYCDIEESNSRISEQFSEVCARDLLIFTESLIRLLQLLTKKRSVQCERIVQQFLSGRSLLRNAMMTCLNLEESHLTDPKALLTTLEEKSLIPFEAKLTDCLGQILQVTTEKLKEAKGEKNILHFLIDDLSGSILTVRHAELTVDFMSKILAFLKERGVLDELVLEPNADGQNVIHRSISKSLHFLIPLFREAVSPVVFSQLIITPDKKRNATPLHIAIAMGDLDACVEIATGATDKDLEAISQVIIDGQSYNVLHLACKSHQNSRMREVQSICEGQKTVAPQSIARSYLFDPEIGCAIDMVNFVLKHFSPADVRRMALERGQFGNTPFSLSCYTNHTALISLVGNILKENRERQQVANTVLTTTNMTPLHVICIFGSDQSLEVILNMLGSSFLDVCLSKSTVSGNASDCCEFTSHQTDAEKDVKQDILMSLVIRIGLYIDETINFNTHFSSVFAMLRSEHDEDKIVNLRGHDSGDNILFVFLRTLSQSNLASDDMQIHFSQFAAAAGEGLLKKLMVSTNVVTQETVLHIVAKEKSLACLLPLFEQKIGAEVSQLLLTDKEYGDTPFHTAVRSQNIEFIRFLRKNVNDVQLLQKCGSQKSQTESATVFHLVPVSCFTPNVLKLKQMLEGRVRLPAQPLSRWLLSNNQKVGKVVYDILAELIEIFGDNAIPTLCEADASGSTYIMLCCYLDDPELLHGAMAAAGLRYAKHLELWDNAGDDVKNTLVTPEAASKLYESQLALLAKSANQGITTTRVTPVQLLLGFGSAVSISKLFHILGNHAEDACLQVNQYLGGKNAIRCCDLSTIDHQKVRQLSELREVYKVLRGHIPPLSENELFHEVRPGISMLTFSVITNQIAAGIAIFETIPKTARGLVVDFSHPVELMMDILYQPNIDLAPYGELTAMSPRSPRNLSLFSNGQGNEQEPVKEFIEPVTKITDFRVKLLKRIFGVLFIPPALMEKMVRLVTEVRISNPTVFDQRLLLNSMLCDSLQASNQGDPIKNHACVFLASINLVSTKLTSEENIYCTRLAEDPRLLPRLLGEFLTYLDSGMNGPAKQFLAHLSKSDSLLRRAILTVFKDRINEKDLKDEEKFADKVTQLINSAVSLAKK